MTAASSIASLVAPSAASAAGRSVASTAEPSPDASFEAFLREAQAGEPPVTEAAAVARDVAVAPVPAIPSALAPVADPVAPLLPPPPPGSATDQPAAGDMALQDQALPPSIIPGFPPVVTPAPVGATPEASPLDTGTTVQPAPMPATTQAAVQAQALATHGGNAALVTPARLQPSAPDAAQASAGNTPATATAIDASQLAQLAALASPAGKGPATDLPKPSRPAGAPASGIDALTAAGPQPGEANAMQAQSQAQAAAQGPAGSATKDPLQQLAPTSTEGAGGTDPQAPQPGSAAPATQANFAVELRQVTQAPHGATPTVHVPLEALAVNIARKVEQGLNQFEITLTPAELGKLDISLKITDDGRVHAVLRAERQDTLDLLRQDARTLESQLRQAGLDVGSNALSFQLSQGQAHKYRTAMANDIHGRAGSLDERSADAVATTFIASRRHDGVDIHV